jgi:hypothetical protein
MKKCDAVWTKIGLAFLICVGITAGAKSDVIYQTYTPGNSGSLSGLSAEVFRNPVNGQQLASKFVLPMGQNPTLTEATLHMWNVSGMSDLFQLTLRSDAGGVPANTVLTTFVNPGSITGADDYTFTATTGVPISGGLTYWLVASPNLTADSQFRWSAVNGGELSYGTLNTGTGQWNAWNTLGGFNLAYQLTDNPIPEPGSMALFLTCGALLLLIRFRRC